MFPKKKRLSHKSLTYLTSSHLLNPFFFDYIFAIIIYAIVIRNSHAFCYSFFTLNFSIQRSATIVYTEHYVIGLSDC